MAKGNHDRILDIVVQQDEVTWQNMIQKLIKDEGMNPWDVDVSRLAARYIEMLKKMKGLDLRVSGKVLLASAILLKMKSRKLLTDDIEELDRLMAPPEEMSADEFYEGIDQFDKVGISEADIPPLMPRTPQPRKRKVSIYDLMLALNKALEVRDRRVMRNLPRGDVKIPERNVDISLLISRLHSSIKNHFKTTKEKLTFHKLIEHKTDSKDKLYDFLALLQLANVDHRKIDLIQPEHFGDIEIVKANPDPAAMKAMAEIMKEKEEKESQESKEDENTESVQDSEEKSSKRE